jgi:hypothetical protein
MKNRGLLEQLSQRLTTRGKYKDRPLIVAHLLGGANGVDFNVTDDKEIERRVTLALKYEREIRRQLSPIPDQA